MQLRKLNLPFPLLVQTGSQTLNFAPNVRIITSTQTCKNSPKDDDAALDEDALMETGILSLT